MMSGSSFLGSGLAHEGAGARAVGDTQITLHALLETC